MKDKKIEIKKLQRLEDISFIITMFIFICSPFMNGNKLITFVILGCGVLSALIYLFCGVFKLIFK